MVSSVCCRASRLSVINVSSLAHTNLSPGMCQRSETLRFSHCHFNEASVSQYPIVMRFGHGRDIPDREQNLF